MREGGQRQEGEQSGRHVGVGCKGEGGRPESIYTMMLARKTG
jgi:hypothetical protein